ncbi:MAG: TonB family protein [Bacteroidetes bacterium]|nr:TonB family protein [Bacteroidota bacterium]
MDELQIYLLKVSAGLAIISVPYYFLLRNDPNLNLKRFYLLLGMMASWIFPLIVFRKPELMLNLTPTVFIDPGEVTSLPISIGSASSATGITINWIKIGVMVYLSGLSFMFLKNLFIILRWNLAWKKNRDEEGVAFTRSDQVFTIFRKIFVPASLRDKDDLDNILLHERAHVQQLHFIDLMVMELTLLLTWFNPFSWLISRMIKENHEHLADRQVLSAGINPARYRAQLLNHTLGVNVFRLGNQFNHSLTLKRFKMMKKPKNSPGGIIKMALLVPALLIAMGLTTGMTPQQQKTINGKVVIAETGEPAPGTSVVIANSTVGTVADVKGTFMLNVEGDPELVLSFVGYKTLRVKASKVGKKPLELEEETFELDLETVPLDVKKEDANSVSIKDKNGSDKQPVFVIDGVVVNGIDNIDHETIESIIVLKDSNSEEVKKYNAPDGVVLITSKEAAAKAKKKDMVDVLSTEEKVFYVVEDMPMFPGGKAALKTHIYSNLEYPAKLKKKGVSGEVMVQFLVAASGELQDIKAVSSTQKEFEAPALEVFKGMPKWNPGKQRGKPVPVKVVVPVKFNADKE